MRQKKYKIVYLCADLLDFDGSRGDMLYFINRLKAYNISFEYVEHKTGTKIDLADYDFVYAGVCPQKYENLFLQELQKNIQGIKEYIENGGTMLAIEQSLLFLAEVLNNEEGQKPLIGVLPFTIKQESTYTIGNILLDTELTNGFTSKINGFFNSRYTFVLPDKSILKPFGRILLGQGYLWERGYEGVVYKNFVGTQIRGPVLPRNFDFCDYLIEKMLAKPLPQIESTLEKAAKDQLTKDCEAFIASDEQKKEYVYVS